MPCPHPTLASPMVALAGWCPISPTAAQTTQLLVEPPWMLAVEWDQVTLTCQGLGTTSDTTWYKDGQRWEQNRDHCLTVTERGTYTCDRPGSGHSPTVRVLPDSLVLQVPAWLLVEGDTVTLRCRGWQNMSVTGVQFYHGDEEVRMSLNGTELSLSPLQLNHSGSYHCRGQVYYRGSQNWHSSAPVTVTVHGEPHPSQPPSVPCLGTLSPI
ncbi:low affinity immunoglobulin gamma Fc region receptor II-like [Sylvia atricapilla]|uniref:low affinity immunoglobulin gamma Fc region receptor II-like n=1 Tax=Sylvia atricapilla TaxID=48155 RepID=UPI0033999799